MSKFDPENNIEDAAIEMRRAEQDVHSLGERYEAARDHLMRLQLKFSKMVNAEINRRIDEQE